MQTLRHQLAGVPIGGVARLGAGGAGVAVANAVLGEGINSLIVNDLDVERAVGFVQRVSQYSPDADVSVTTQPCDAMLAVALKIVSFIPEPVLWLPRRFGYTG
jgi:shikimate dehydrogenase